MNCNWDFLRVAQQCIIKNAVQKTRLVSWLNNKLLYQVSLKKPLGTSFYYFRDSFFQILLVIFFFIIHSSFQLNQRGFWPLLQCCKLASFKNLAVAKNYAQNLSTFQMKLKWTSTLSVPSMKTLILIVKNSML